MVPQARRWADPNVRDHPIGIDAGGRPSYGLERVASAWMTVGALSIFPLAILLWYYLFSGLTGGYCGLSCTSWFIAGLASTIALALVTPIGGLVTQARADMLRRAHGLPVQLMALRSLGCVLALLLAVVSLVVALRL